MKMPQRQRHNTGGGVGGAELPLLDPGIIESSNTVTVTRCCVPLAGGCLKGYRPINPTFPTGCIKVFCNNECCVLGNLMHEECFSSWEQTLLAFLRSCWRGRSWSEKRGLQYMWTKGGYSMIYRACECLCGRGHLRKDLHWNPPDDPTDQEELQSSRRKRKNKQNLKPQLVTVDFKNMSTSSAGGSQSNSFNKSSTAVATTEAGFQARASKNKFELITSRNEDGRASLFRNPDISLFGCLSKTKINPYHIKMEDDGQSGCDETRRFILSTLAHRNTSRTACVLCHEVLPVFGRYPLLAGTFFLTPVQHSVDVIPVDIQGSLQYLSCVCVSCLEGRRGTLKCISCHSPWNGSNLILGTMYRFDIFAAMPCCHEKVQCRHCRSPLIPLNEPLPYYSEFSRSKCCPTCRAVDYHFVKSVKDVFYKEKSRRL